ncbi:MAG: XrtA system polysaccharide deacetylase [Gemmatimonadota bacterium]|nr:XrtA system polysaccharide deacetylase [Gemmatimonadota bacterium]
MTAHHFTVDVEEYFHPTALAPHYPMDIWDGLERRSPGVIDRLLEFLEDRDVLGTFFVVGWLAEREPEMVKRIARAGHEVASHSWEHELVGRLGPDGFRDSLRRSKDVLETLSGAPVLGYRAPSFSIVPGLEWAFDVLLEEGYRYDASLFPVSQHPTYGYPDAEPDPYWVERPSGRLAEFPATTARLLGQTLPASGGAYFRVLPYGLVRRGLRQAGARRAPGMFYIHPWEMDDWVPDVDAPRLQMVRTFAGRRRTWRRLDRMFGDFAFRPIRTTLEEMPG